MPPDLSRRNSANLRSRSVSQETSARPWDAGTSVVAGNSGKVGRWTVTSGALAAFGSPGGAGADWKQPAKARLSTPIGPKVQIRFMTRLATVPHGNPL